MSGLMQRILRRRDPGEHAPRAPVHTEPAHPSPPPEPAATSHADLAAVPAAAGGSVAADATPATDPNGSPLQAPAAPAGAGDRSAAAVDPLTTPAGVDPEAVAGAGLSFRERGRLRRRLRFLRRLRELGFRDLGGLVFEQHRFDRREDELVRGKLMALAAVDAELRALEHTLRDHRPITELREPGVSACARCGAVIASDARFCSACGTPVGGAQAIPAVGEAGQPGVTDAETERSTRATAPAHEQPTVITPPADRPPS